MIPPGRSLIFVFAALILAFPRAVTADTHTGQITKDSETKAYLRASGQVTITDNENDGIAYLLNVQNCQYWFFHVAFYVTQWDINPPPQWSGARGIQGAIQGFHLEGPHVEDQDPNNLPTVYTNAANIIFNRAARLTAAHRVDHPAGENNHKDEYALCSFVTPVQGPPHSIQTDSRVQARHYSHVSDPPPMEWYLDWETVGSSSTPGGANSSYDHTTGELILTAGPIDVLNRTGETEAGIDPIYAGDPILFSMMTVTPLVYLGPSEDGGFLFGDGWVEILAPDEKHSVAGWFPEMTIYPGPIRALLTSVAILDDFWITDVGEETEQASLFLENLAHVNVFGEGLSDSVWTSGQGNVLSIDPIVDLVEATQGFTQSVVGIPTAIVLSAARADPPVTAIAEGNVPSRSGLRLTPGAPNPMNRSTRFTYTIPGDRASAEVRLGIYDTAGRLVRELVNSSLPAGTHHATWDGTDRTGGRAGSGVYFCRLRWSGEERTERVVLIW
jgi:hypothetical protein